MSMIEVAHELASTFSARAADGEAQRTMPADLVAAARRAGLFRVAVPRSLGGLELDPLTVVEVVAEISRADGSAGWTVLIGNALAFFAWLDPAVTKEMLGDELTSCPPACSRRRAERSPTVRGTWCSTGAGVQQRLRPRRLVPDRSWSWTATGRRCARTGGRTGASPTTGGGGPRVIDTCTAPAWWGTGSHDVAVRGLRLPEAHRPCRCHDPPRTRATCWSWASSFVHGRAARRLPAGRGPPGPRRGRRPGPHQAPAGPGRHGGRGPPRPAGDRPRRGRPAERGAFVDDAFGRAWTRSGPRNPDPRAAQHDPAGHPARHGGRGRRRRRRPPPGRLDGGGRGPPPGPLPPATSSPPASTWCSAVKRYAEYARERLGVGA